MMMNVYVVLEHGIEIVRRNHARCGGSQRIADESENMVIADQLRIFREQLTLLGILNFLFELRHSALASELEERRSG